MPTVTISARAHDAIRRASTDAAFHETGIRLPTGEWSVPLTSELVSHIEDAQHPGETLSDTIERLLAVAPGQKLS